MNMPTPHAVRRSKRAQIIRFPLARQRSLVMKLAQRVAAQVPARAEKTLRLELDRLIDALHRQGLSDRAVEVEICAFESAIRAELWHLTLLPEFSNEPA
jgi:Family of unknown function (DUF6074)